MTPAQRHVLMSSKSTEWETPQAFFDTLNAIFEFNLDVCATKENAKCSRYFTLNDDGLTQTWAGTCWMNPPYNRQIKKWVKKAYESALDGSTIVCLLPARTDTKWWHTYCERARYLFISGRLKFNKSLYNAPFPSAVVVFSPETLKK